METNIITSSRLLIQRISHYSSPASLPSLYHHPPRWSSRSITKTVRGIRRASSDTKAVGGGGSPSLGPNHPSTSSSKPHVTRSNHASPVKVASEASNVGASASQRSSQQQQRQRSEWWRHFVGPVNAYARFQNRRPWAAQVYASVPIYIAGDALAQYFDGQEYDVWRTVRQLAIGIGAAVPGYSWFMWLNRHFNYSTHLRSLVTKIFVNQMTFVPIFNVYFFSLQSLLAGSTVQEAVERVRNTLPTSWANSFKLWPAVTAFSFTYIEAQYRFLFGGIFAVVWQSYLSWLNQRDVERNSVATLSRRELAQT